MDSNRKKFLLIALASGLILALLLAPAVYFYGQYQKTKNQLSDSQALTKGDIDLLIKKVGLLIELPDETPTVATVSDVEKLRGQVFFTRAQNGDRVLVFKESKKAILYDPVNNKIREVGPVEITAPTPTGTQGQTQGVSDSKVPTILKAATVALLNGTSTENLASEAETSLVSARANTKVIGRAFAVKRDYPETIVVDISGGKNEEAAAAARVFNARVIALPPEEQPVVNSLETRPDIVIILGADFASRFNK